MTRWARGVLLFVLVIGVLSAAWALIDDEFEPPVAPLRIEVLNGCGENQLGARVAQRLRRLGQDVRDVSDTAREDHGRSVLIDRRGRPQLARRLARELGGLPVILERRAGSTIDVSLLLGKDYGDFALLQPQAAADH